MEYKDINDYELIYLISDVQDDEVMYLLEKYEPFIQKKCMKWKTVLDKMNMEMEDLQQEVRIAFLDAVRNFKEEKDTVFYTYLNVVIDNQIKNLVRSMNSNKKLISSNCVSLSSVYSDRELEDFIPNKDEDIEKKIELQEVKEKIYEFLYKIPIDKAFVLELYFNSYSLSSISKLLDESKNTVRSTLRIYRKKLKDYLKKFKFSML